MSYSRRQLYAMGEPLGESVTRKEGGRIIYGGGGGGGPTQTNVTQSNVPDWLRPQVENVLMGAGKNLFQTKKLIAVKKMKTALQSITKRLQALSRLLLTVPTPLNT